MKEPSVQEAIKEVESWLDYAAENLDAATLAALDRLISVARATHSS